MWLSTREILFIGKSEDRPSRHSRNVMGLIAGWGIVALHGRERFRPQRAAIFCLFSDSISESRLDSLAIRRSTWFTDAHQHQPVSARDAGDTSSPAPAGFRERR